MTSPEILIREQCGSVGQLITYVNQGNNEIKELEPPNKFTKSYQIIANFFREILLPYGYPDSVSEDYLNYQIWDTLQAFCSTITAAFTTRAILKGVGVGDGQASALSATVTWIMKDGTGMIGRILFAWWKGNGLDSDCKKWRLFADVLNDVAMSIELFLPYFTEFSMEILCVTTGMKSIVGIAGGATRASITHHQAIKDNMAEISAKDGSQETCVNLIACLASIILLHIVEDSIFSWSTVFFLMILHVYANYKAVSSLIFRNFNGQRLAIVLKSYFTIGTVLNPVKVNAKESVFLGFGKKVTKVCGFDIVLGESLKKCGNFTNAANFSQTLSYYSCKNYFIVPDFRRRLLFITFEQNEKAEDVIAAYFHATCLAIAICIYNGIELDIFSKRQLKHVTPIARLNTYMRKYDKNLSGSLTFPHHIHSHFTEFVDQEFSMFLTALNVNDWITNSHSLQIGEWRTLNKKVS